jgi:hypothetical protein
MQPCVDFLKNAGLLFHNDCATHSRGTFFMARERFQAQVRPPHAPPIHCPISTQGAWYSGQEWAG